MPWISLPGSPDASSTCPQTMTVDYVRAYANSGGTTPPPTGAGAITGLAGKCADVAATNSGNGTPVQLYTCNGTAAQNWTLAADGSVRALGKCLDGQRRLDRQRRQRQLWDCNGSGAQKWTYTAGPGLVNLQANKCLDVRGNSRRRRHPAADLDLHRRRQPEVDRPRVRTRRPGPAVSRSYHH